MNYKPASLFMNLKVVNLLQLFDGIADLKTIIKWYQSAIRSLIWPAVHTCPDIAYLVGVFSWYCSNPGSIYYLLVIQIFYYLFGILDFRITFKINSSNEINSYSDSDYTGFVNGRKSIGRYIFMVSAGSLSHQSKL